MYDVFLSYSRADAKIADQIYKKLSDNGLNVFYDRESINAERFASKITQGIKESKVILFLASGNSVTSNFASDELIYAKNHKPRNSLIVYKIDSFSFPDDIEFLLSSLNHRDIASDSLDVILEDIYQILAQGSISRMPRVTKSRDVDATFSELLNAYYNLDFYSVIYHEIEKGYWTKNWNHHLLLMMAYMSVGDRYDYGILLNMYQSSGIVYYPNYYGVISQVWDMIKFGYIKETRIHIDNLLRTNKTELDRICSNVNYSHCLLLSGEHQEALNNYKEIYRSLNLQARYSYLLKDFDTLKWLGYNQINGNVISTICSIIGYKQKSFNTSSEGHVACCNYENLLCSHRWHWREGRLHMIISFRSFNGIGNTIYDFVEYERNLLGKIFDVLPYGIDESKTVQNSGRAFCQYRLTKRNKRLFLEEYNPVTDVISCGEILLLNSKELHIKIFDNGNPLLAGKIRKYKALKD